MSNGFKNFHLSVSRLRRYEQCPESFKLHYIKKFPSEFGEAGQFGKLLHDTLWRLFDWVIREEFVGFLPEEKMLEFYRAAWQESGLTGLALYQEGLSILRKYIRQHPKIDHFDILGVEIEFDIQLEEFVVNGAIDRIDKIDDETIRIIDYKSNRLLFTREEVEVDLQMSVYALAARHLWPWARKFEFVFHMLRHDTYIATKRTSEQIIDAASYVVDLGRKTETDQEFLPRLNPNCGYCDHRAQCDAYKKAITNKLESVAINKEDLEEVARVRERVAMLAKAAYRRKDELDAILRTHVERRGELELAGMRYQLVPASHTEYPVEKTLEKIARVTGMKQESVRSEILGVDNKKLDALVERVEESSRSRAILLKAELETIAEKQPMKPRLYGTKIAAPKRSESLLSQASMNRVKLLPRGKTEET